MKFLFFAELAKPNMVTGQEIKVFFFVM